MRTLLYVLASPLLFVVGLLILVLWGIFHPWADDMIDVAAYAAAKLEAL